MLDAFGELQKISESSKFENQGTYPTNSLAEKMMTIGTLYGSLII